MQSTSFLSSITLTSVAILSLALQTTTALTFDCSQVVIGDFKFDLSPLGGPHSVISLEQTPVSILNTTFTLDICKPLLKTGDKYTDPPTGSRVYALERFYDDGEKDEPRPKDIWAIAGEFIHNGRGGELNPKYTRLRNSGSHADADREGLRVELNGGDHAGVKQKAIVEFVCDQDKTGLEGLTGKAMADKTRREEEDGDGQDRKPLPDPNEGKSLKFLNYRVENTGGSGSHEDEEMGVLRLEWMTKYACEKTKGGKNREDDPVPGTPPSKTSGWGFFTWFIVIIFLGIAAYLIFGSWLNYSRHGARGWDLLPHGDTIRDLPYLLKDWSRRVVSTVQGGNGRGYSAI